MSKTAPLYDSDKLAKDDIFKFALHPMARLLQLLLNMLADRHDGYLRAGPVALTLEQAAATVGFAGDVSAAAAQLFDFMLLAEDDQGIYIPEQRERARLRAARQAAGKKGGEITTANRTDLRVVSSSGICSSKNSGTEDTTRRAAENRARRESFRVVEGGNSKKEKRTKKEKINKYIYISSRKVFTGNRGEKDNIPAYHFENFTVFDRELDALQLEFPFFDEDKLVALMDAHDRFMSESGIPAANWHIPFCAGLKKLHAKLAA